jgi:hypothetical protein
MPATAASGQAPAAEQPGHPPDAQATRYQRTYPGRADQVSQVRREIARHLSGRPAAEDAVLIASELAANAIIHTQSRGSTFTIRCHASPGQVRIEVEDLGGPWRPRQGGDRPHGLDIVQALTGPGQWGTQPSGTGGRIVWARLTW